MNFIYLKTQKDFHDLMAKFWGNEEKVNSMDSSGNDMFESFEEWLNFFGARNPYPEGIDDGKVAEDLMLYGPFEVEPAEYPSIAAWHFEKSFDRTGKVEIRLFDIVLLKKLKKEKS